MTEQSNLIKLTARLVVATLIVVIMVVGKSFLVPLAWAFLIGAASYEFLNRMEEKTKLNRSVINMFFLLFILGILLGTGYFFYLELSHIFKDLPAIANAVSNRLHDISFKFKEMGIIIPDHINKALISDWVQGHSELILKILSGIGLNLWNVVLIMFYLFFILRYRDLVFQFYIAKIKNRHRLVMLKTRFLKSLELIRGYLYGLVLLTFISAAMNYLVFLIFGLDFGLFFAVFLALLNLIPFIGNPVGLAVIMLFAIISNDNMLTPLLIFISLFVANFLQDNVIRTWVVGDKMKINAFAVFVAIIIGGMIWGVSGMILFIPIAGIAKIILESMDDQGVYAILFSELPKKTKKPIKPEQTMVNDKNIESE